jgi:hypothetical protein
MKKKSREKGFWFPSRFEEDTVEFELIVLAFFGLFLRMERERVE